MTVGEKIQFFRKKNGLSQEELGQRLLVSRQTVSLWEMDKTMPTVDNLLRLKEIFGVSIDDMLSEDKSVESIDTSTPPICQSENISKTEKPLESYAISYERPELIGVFRAMAKRSFRIAVPAFLFCLIIIFGGIYSQNTVMLTLASFMGALVLCVYLMGYFRFRRGTYSVIDRYLDTAYEYEAYEDYILVTVRYLSSGEVSKFFKVNPADIIAMTDIGSYYVMEYSGLAFIIRKKDLAADSVLHRIYKEKSEYKKPKKQGKSSLNPLETAAAVLIALSVLSIWIALIIASVISSDANLQDEMWVYFACIPIPTASIVFALVLKKKGHKYMKNLVVGIIMVALLCCWGLTYENNKAWSFPITRAESVTGLDLPVPFDIDIDEYGDDNQPVPSKGYIYYITRVELDHEAARDFETELRLENKWMEELPVSMMGIKPPYPNVIISYEYFYIHNITEDKANTLPSADGKYRFLAMCYNTHDDTILITEYEVNYTR